MSTTFALLFLLSAVHAIAHPRLNRPGSNYRPYVQLRSGDRPPLYQDELNHVAERKRQYQAAFSSLASRTAAQNMASQKLSLVLQPAKGLYQPQGYTGPVFAPARQQHPSQHGERSLFQPITFIHRGVQNQPDQPTRPETVNVLPDGHLDDTEEVKAAKREHFAAVAKVKAAAARDEQRRKLYAGPVRK